VGYFPCSGLSGCRDKPPERKSMKETVYYRIWADVYRLMEKHLHGDDWRQLDQDCLELHRKYAGELECRFLEDLIVTIYDELERRYERETAEERQRRRA